jgi:hypothetical protein
VRGGRRGPRAQLAPLRAPRQRPGAVRTYSRYRLTASTGQHLAGGYSDLRCGSQNWGYRHIVDRHLGQWEQKAALTRQNWREVADYGIEWALRDPDRGTYRSSNGMSACQITSLVQALK